MKKWLLVIFALLPLTVFGDAADSLDDYVGYTIAASTHVAGYFDEKGKKSDDFEGCEFGRRILFDDGTSLTCSTYHYHYSFHPKAVILVKASNVSGQRFASVIMIVGDDAYSMQGFVVK